MISFKNALTKKDLFLLMIAVISVIFVGMVRTEFISRKKVPRIVEMKESVDLTKKWFEIICAEKIKRSIKSDASSIVEFAGMLGNDFTLITTTLGSIEAKELSTNPSFAALITRLIIEAGVDSGSTVGVSLSGSFPALAVAVLASLQTIGAEAIIYSSVGASSYGANQPDATWPDMESWLREKGCLKFRTTLLTPGSENDNGDGLIEEGFSLIQRAADRNSLELYVAESLEESIALKLKILIKNKIDLYINIGGNQASVGACAHTMTIPNGLNYGTKICSDENRGLISLIAEQGIPYLHLLNLKDLAVQYGIPLEPGAVYGSDENIYSNKSVNKPVVIAFVIILAGLLVVYKTRINS